MHLLLLGRYVYIIVSLSRTTVDKCTDFSYWSEGFDVSEGFLKLLSSSGEVGRWLACVVQWGIPLNTSYHSCMRGGGGCRNEIIFSLNIETRLLKSTDLFLTGQLTVCPQTAVQVAVLSQCR